MPAVAPDADRAGIGAGRRRLVTSGRGVPGSAGTYDSAQLGNVLDLLDAEQIAVEMRKGKKPIRNDEPGR